MHELFSCDFSFFHKQAHDYYLHLLEKNVKDNTERSYFCFVLYVISTLHLIAA